MKDKWYLSKPLTPEPVKVAKLRMKLAEYFSSVCSERGCVYSTGAHGDVFLMSPETLKQLEMRHAVNVWARKAYMSMELDSRMTLMNGIRTKGLPEQTLTGMQAFFQIICVITSWVSEPGCNARMADWEITTALQDALGPEPVRTNGPLFWDEIHDVVDCLYGKEPFMIPGTVTFDGEARMNIAKFLERISVLSFDARTEPYTLIDQELTKEQHVMVNEMLHEFSVWTRQVLWIQPFDFDLKSSDVKRIEAQYGTLQELYEKNIGPVPPVSFFPM